MAILQYLIKNVKICKQRSTIYNILIFAKKQDTTKTLVVPCFLTNYVLLVILNSQDLNRVNLPQQIDHLCELIHHQDKFLLHHIQESELKLNPSEQLNDLYYLHLHKHNLE